jgi:hypothetical protein
MMDLGLVVFFLVYAFADGAGRAGLTRENSPT